MSIIKVNISDIETVKFITTETINSIYPRYYPEGAVNFFLSHHNDKNIENDIKSEFVYLCFDDENNGVGTVTIKENEIGRLFVLPEYQGKGYGRELISFAENEISKKYNKIILHASLPAKAIYLKRGYKEVEFHSLKTENGDYLCYDMMIKQIQNKAI